MVLIWLIKWVFYNFFLSCIKMNGVQLRLINSLSKKNTVMTLNRAKDYYENDKERLREQARDKYRNLSEEEQKKKR